MSVRIELATAPQPGAIALIQLHGHDAAHILEQLTGRSDFPNSVIRYVKFADIDDGMAVMLKPDWVQLAPHGGPRVVQRLIRPLLDLGCTLDNQVDPRQTYPEADSAIEADMLAALARAASPAAVDRLLVQPRLWREAVRQKTLDFPRIHENSRRLDRLLDPPTVVLVGRPNVGKSTLTNQMLGRSVSLVADLPGTTRDWVAGLAELSLCSAGEHHHDLLAVRWLDTPGIRHSDDPIEQRAIDLARQVIRSAEVIITMRDPDSDWPALDNLDREPDVRVINKVDLVTVNDDSALGISALHGRGIDQLQRAVIGKMGLGDLPIAPLWAFCDRLKSLVIEGDPDRLNSYVKSQS